MKTITLLAAAVVLTAGANADIIYFQGPGNFPNDENVIHNESGLINFGPLVQGQTNQSGAIVDFFDAGEDLFTPAQGQARVEAVDGGFQMLSIAMNDPGLAIGTLVLNLNSTANGSVTFSADRLVGAPVGATFNLDSGGQNFFRVQATDGDMITKFNISTTVDIADIRQVRLGAVIPEPTTAAAILSGLGLLLARRKRR